MRPRSLQKVEVKNECKKLNFGAKKEHVGGVTCQLSKSHLSCHGKLTLILGELV